MKPNRDSSKYDPQKWQGLDGGGGAAGLLSSALQGMTTVTAFNMQGKLTEDYRKASEVFSSRSEASQATRSCVGLSG